MNKWRLTFDGELPEFDETVTALALCGYIAASLRGHDGVVTYFLAKRYNPDLMKTELIFKTTDPEELNRYINLILPPRS